MCALKLNTRLCLGLLLLSVSVVPTSHAQQASQAPEGRVLQIIPLQFVEADGNLVKRLSVVLPGATMAVDERTNTLIIQSDPAQLIRAKELLAVLDVPAAPKEAAPAHRDRQVRIVWLMSGLTQGGAVPEDIQPIIEELGRYSVTGLELVTQTIVRGRDTFTTSAFPDLDGRPVRLQIQGRFSSQGGSDNSAQMEINLSANTTAITTDAVAQPVPAARAPNESLAQLQTTVLAPFGHPVVLCMTPVNRMTSVFIVEVVPAR